MRNTVRKLHVKFHQASLIIKNKHHEIEVLEEVVNLLVGIRIEQIKNSNKLAALIDLPVIETVLGVEQDKHLEVEVLAAFY